MSDQFPILLLDALQSLPCLICRRQSALHRRLGVFTRQRQCLVDCFLRLLHGARLFGLKPRQRFGRQPKFLSRQRIFDLLDRLDHRLSRLFDPLGQLPRILSKLPSQSIAVLGQFGVRVPSVGGRFPILVQLL